MLITLIGCATKKEQVVDCSNPQIEYSGRINHSPENGAELYWSGTSIKLNFEGKSIAALLADEKGDNYYNVILNNDSVFMIRPDTTKSYHVIAKDLPKGKHTIELFKRTEWDRGKTSFYGFKIKGNPKLLSKHPESKRKIEFYGNSITAGYAVEDLSGKDSPDSTYTNNYLSYAAITARHYDAKYHAICKSGIGVTVSWFPLIMPEMYDRLTPEDPTSKWDFSLYTPDIVVINLFQNDSWIVNRPDFEQYKMRFKDIIPDEEYLVNAYQKFVTAIRNKYPKAKIICMLGNMDITRKGSKWAEYVTKAVGNLNDKNMYTLFVPFKETPGHPSIKEQEIIAESLIKFIDKHIVW
ncbi:SGNH/GDSL hydrolase family protein [Flavobacteriaceae bacterium MHTCC 0001]